MPIYCGGKKIKVLYFGGKKITSAWYGGKCVYRDVVALFSGPKTFNGPDDYISVDIPTGTKSIVIKFDKYITSAKAEINGTTISIKNGSIVFPVPTTSPYEEHIEGTVSFDIYFDESGGKKTLQMSCTGPTGNVGSPVTVVGIYAG
ncbi:hypothetical protein EFT87_14550 [Schleiferilactobacillus harbinensis]|uniref:hypothetical protein n=1 Tax=Schleiferilactobacillus harbinensis TaxID=304207 RepID=UPI0021A3333D|nr:hypothetical protein [Schleiferilactobacillus harbinensis]MCT2909860.1 hypothetical protein [Schleiferilactobacillus harbinensis]